MSKGKCPGRRIGDAVNMHAIQSQALSPQCVSFIALFYGHYHLSCMILTYIIDKTGFQVPTCHYFGWIKQDIEQNIASKSGLHNIVTAWILLFLWLQWALIHCYADIAQYDVLDKLFYLSVLICYATHFSVVWISSSVCFYICNVHLLVYIMPYYHLINICRWEVGRYNCLKMRKLWWRQTELLMWRKTLGQRQNIVLKYGPTLKDWSQKMWELGKTEDDGQ